MRFSNLSQYFEKLEKTSSRLALIDTLSDLFKQTDQKEIRKIVYLLQGRLAPFFVPLEIGMAEKNVASSVADAYKSSKENVLKLFTKLGDEGLAAEELNRKNGTKDSGITVEEVCETLEKIANTKGEGTVEKRKILLTSLLEKSMQFPQEIWFEFLWVT